MFGILWSVFAGLGTIKNKITRDIKDSKSRSQSTGMIYLDWCARTRLVSNNHICHEEVVDGYKRIKDLETGQIIWDERKEVVSKAKERYKKSANERQTSTFRCDEHRSELGYVFPYKFTEIKGHQYKDIKNDQIYVIREWMGCFIFIDVITKKAIRFTDYQNVEFKRKCLQYKKTFGDDDTGKMIFNNMWRNNNEDYIIKSYNESHHVDLELGAACVIGEDNEDKMDFRLEEVKEILQRYERIFG